MRGRIWFCGTFMILTAVFTWLSSFGAAPPTAKADPKSPLDNRDDVADRLMERVTIEQAFDQVPLKEVLDFLSNKYDLNVIVDPISFKAQDAAALAVKANNEDAIIRRPVDLPAMKKVRLATVLKYVCDQIDGVYLLYPDHIELVSGAKAFTLLRLSHNNFAEAGNDQEAATEPLEKMACSIPLVNVNLVDRSLQEALREVEIRTNRSIVLAPQAGERSKTAITTRLTNVPVDTAVATLAELAGLKMVRKSNVFLVTTSERAKEFDPPLPQVPVQPQIVSAPVPVPNAPETEELKKKIAELEKAIGELKNKK